MTLYRKPFKVLDSSASLDDFEKVVAAHLEEGYILSGPLQAFDIGRSNLRFIQAVALAPEPAPTEPDMPPTVTISADMGRALSHLLTHDMGERLNLNAEDVQAALYEVRRQYLQLIAPKGR